MIAEFLDRVVSFQGRRGVEVIARGGPKITEQGCCSSAGCIQYITGSALLYIVEKGEGVIALIPRRCVEMIIWHLGGLSEQLRRFKVGRDLLRRLYHVG